MKKLSIVSFGATGCSASKPYKVVRVSLQSQHSRQKINSLESVVVPNICMNVLAVPKSSISKHDANIELADARLENYEIKPGIQVLIGANQYWKFVSGKNERMTPNLTAVETLFGWTLQGAEYNNIEENISSIGFTLALKLDGRSRMFRRAFVMESGDRGYCW